MTSLLNYPSRLSPRYSHPVTSSRPEYIALQQTQQRLNPQSYELANPQSYELANPQNQVDPNQQQLQQQQQPMSRSYTSNTSYTQHQYQQATSPGRRYVQ